MEKNWTLEKEVCKHSPDLWTIRWSPRLWGWHYYYYNVIIIIKLKSLDSEYLADVHKHTENLKWDGNLGETYLRMAANNPGITRYFVIYLYKAAEWRNKAVAH